MCWSEEEESRGARERRGISTGRVEEDVGGMVTTVGLADSRVLQSLTGPGLLQAHGCRRLMWEERRTGENEFCLRCGLETLVCGGLGNVEGVVEGCSQVKEAPLGDENSTWLQDTHETRPSKVAGQG